MSYYFKDKSTNKVYSDVVPGANKIKQVYRYKTLNDPNSTHGYGMASPTLFLKDGTFPILAGVYATPQNLLSSYNWSYMPIAAFTISSISGRYNITGPEDFGTYYMSYDLTPEMYRYEIFKTENGTFKPIITDIDYNKGGRISWRISEENLKFFNYSYKGPADTYIITAKVLIPHSQMTLYFTGFNSDTGVAEWNQRKQNAYIINTIYQTRTIMQQIQDQGAPGALDYELFNQYSDSTGDLTEMNLNFFNMKNFDGNGVFFPDSNAWTSLNGDSIGFFIKSIPYHNSFNKFGFNLSYATGCAPSHFNLSINDIKNAGYNKLHIQMDGLYLYANNGWNNKEEYSPSYQSQFINNTASFYSDSYLDKNKYCQALFYAIDDNTTWVQDSITTAVDYMGNGRIYSNLTANKNYMVDRYNWVNHKPVANDKDYTFSHTANNTKYGPEIQNPDTNINVWKHFALKYVTDANKSYTTGSKQEGAAYGKAVTAESAVCPNFPTHKVHIDNIDKDFCWEPCPYCNGSPQVDYNVSAWYIKCGDNITKAFVDNVWGVAPSIGNIAKSHDGVIGIKAPVTGFFYDPDVGATITARGWWILQHDSHYSVASGTVCDGTGIGRVLSGVNNRSYWLKHETQGDGWNIGDWEYMHNKYSPYKSPKPTTETAVCPTCAGNKKIECYCYDNTKETERVIKGYMGSHPPVAAGKLKHKDCNNGTGIVYPYTNNTLIYRFKMYGKSFEDIGTKTPNKFEGFITHTALSSFSASDAYMKGTLPPEASKLFTGFIQLDYDADNWDEQAQEAIDGDVVGCYSYKDTTPDDFVDYREKLLGTSAKNKGKLLEESYDNWKDSEENKDWNYKNWLIMADWSTRGDSYYYPDTTNYTPGHIGIMNSQTFDVAWSAKQYDSYNNDITYLSSFSHSTADFTAFNTTGFTPSAGSNFSYSQVKLDYTIDLTNETRNYIHIAFPYVTVLNNENYVATAGLIPQMIMTYEGTN